MELSLRGLIVTHPMTDHALRLSHKGMVCQRGDHMCIYIYMRACTYAHARACACRVIGLRACMHSARMYVCMYVSVYVCMYVCTSVCVCMCVCAHVGTNKQVRVYMYAGMYVCMHVFECIYAYACMYRRMERWRHG